MHCFLAHDFVRFRRVDLAMVTWLLVLIRSRRRGRSSDSPPSSVLLRFATEFFGSQDIFTGKKNGGGGVGEGWVEEFSSENLGFILSFIAHYLGHLNLSSPPQSSLIYVTHDGGELIFRECP